VKGVVVHKRVDENRFPMVPTLTHTVMYRAMSRKVAAEAAKLLTYINTLHYPQPSYNSCKHPAKTTNKGKLLS
jgi:hypothetical protein